MPNITETDPNLPTSSGVVDALASDSPGNVSLSLSPCLKTSLRLMYGGEIALGPGKAELLEAIRDAGSISAAGKGMDMSYRRAWQLVEVMNRCFKGPLVETAKGGSHGGGARLTPLGETVLARYRAMERAAKQVGEAYLGLFDNLFRE